MENIDVLWKLLLAALLGGIVGIERESINRPAGLRTHILVCVGAALMMMVSIDMYHTFSGAPADPGRIAAQVVSGIGFLGAGTILREGMTIRGLTTAASLWVIAGIGLAVGMGMVIPAVATAGIVLISLGTLSRLEKAYLHRRRSKILVLTISDRPGQLGRIGTILGDSRVNIVAVEMKPGLESGFIRVEFSIVLPQDLDQDQLTEFLLHVDGVHCVEYGSHN